MSVIEDVPSPAPGPQPIPVRSAAPIRRLGSLVLIGPRQTPWSPPASAVSLCVRHV
jgi:hypothetical protein